MELVKGDWENLEGKVMVYGKLDLSNNEDVPEELRESGAFGGSYATTDAVDYMNFLKKLGASSDLINELSEAEFKIDKEVKKMEMEGKMFMVRCISGIHIPNEEDILIKDHDVLKIGTYYRLNNLANAEDFAVKYYMMRFEDQLMDRHNIGNILNGKTERDKNNVKEHELQTYKDVDSAKIGWYLFNTFVNPLMYLYKSGESEKADSIAKDAMTFSSGSLFMPEVLKLLEIMKIGGANPNKRLIECYVEEIDAISREDYETAARARNEILSMEK